MEKIDLVRKNIRMSPYVANWYEDKSVELGISQTNLMVIALNEYIKQEQAMKMMSNFDYVMQELEKLKAKSEK